MRSEIVSVGTELLLGAITDTNATWISQELQKIGLDVIFRTTVGDNEERIAAAISIALSRVDVVIVTGGLGPTVDDVTREAIARATARPLIFHQELLDQIAERFKRFKVSMTQNNRRQAYAPKDAILVENPVGTAPIFILDLGEKAIMCLPGVPREMEYLFSNSLRPWLQQYVGAPAAIYSLTLRTAGIGESVIDSKIDDLMKLTNPTVGLAAHSGQTDVRITAKASTEAGAIELIEPVEADIRSRLGEWIYATGSEDIEFAVARRLSTEELSLAIVELGTEHLFEKRLTAANEIIPLQMNVVAYQISHGYPLADEALTFAEDALKVHGAQLSAVAIITNGPSGVTEIAIDVANAQRHLARSYSWATPRSDGPIWVTTQCMALLLRLLDGHNS